MAHETINVPDLGGADDVEVIEIAVKVGDRIEVEDPLLVLESDKASIDLPSPRAGVVKEILVKVGDTVSQGTAIVEIEAGDAAADTAAEAPAADDTTPPEPAPATSAAAPSAAADDNAADESEQSAAEQSAAPPADEAGQAAAQTPAQPTTQPTTQTVTLPDLGTGEAVDLIEISVAVGDTVAEGDTLMTLEGDKATMDMPSPFSGTVTALLVEEGTKVKSGDAVAEMAVAAPAQAEPEQPAAEQAKPEKAQSASPAAPETPPQAPTPTAAAPAPSGALNEAEAPAAAVYAGPMVRQLARELGVDLRNVTGSGDKERITRDDVRGYVKQALAALDAGGTGSGAGIPAVPDVDYRPFGDIEEIPLSRIGKLTAANMSRTWLNVPAVTQFDDADITELEDFRRGLKDEAEQRGVKLTPVAFLLLACARALRAHPTLNRSWHSSGERLIQKQFVHIGMAVNTPRGLLVPVIRDVDKKGLWELAEESAALAHKARDGKLSAAEMQGGSFSLSSLGALGGRGFTPIVNSPEAAILGVSKAAIQPVWNGEEFVPRQLLPLSLSYDHRLINGADAGAFLTDLVAMIGDIRRLLL